VHRRVTPESAARNSGGQLVIESADVMLAGPMHSLTTSSNSTYEVRGPECDRQTARAETAVALGAVVRRGSGTSSHARAGTIADRVASGLTSVVKVSVPAGSLVEFGLRHRVPLAVKVSWRADGE
jgi:hypothetical protein